MEKKKEGCDKLKDLLCEYPHCTCMAMQRPVVDENFASTKSKAKTLAEDVFYNDSDSNK